MEKILITGASSGIGEAYAKHFATQRCHMVLVARSTKKLIKLQKDLQSKSVTIDIIPMDLSEQNAAKNLYTALNNMSISITTLINNAGFATKGLFTDTTCEVQYNEIMLNITFLTEISHYLLKDMIHQNTGTIINIASSAGFNPVPYGAVYSSTKAYVLSLTRCLAYEYKKTNINFLAVCPGPTNTNFFKNFQSAYKRMRRPEQVVQTSLIALKKKKIICSDGLMAKLQSSLPFFVSRKMAVRITGYVGKKTWA